MRSTLETFNIGQSVFDSVLSVMEESYVIVDKDNKVIGIYTNEKTAKSQLNSGHLIKKNGGVKVVQTKVKQSVGFPLKEETIDEAKKPPFDKKKKDDEDDGDDTNINITVDNDDTDDKDGNDDEKKKVPSKKDDEDDEEGDNDDDEGEDESDDEDTDGDGKKEKKLSDKKDSVTVNPYMKEGKKGVKESIINNILAHKKALNEGKYKVGDVIKSSDILKSFPTPNGGTFTIVGRDTSYAKDFKRPDAEDKISMYVRDNRGKVTKDLGSHSNLNGAIKFGKNKGLIKEGLNEESYPEESEAPRPMHSVYAMHGCFHFDSDNAVVFVTDSYVRNMGLKRTYVSTKSDKKAAVSDIAKQIMADIDLFTKENKKIFNDRIESVKKIISLKK